MELAPQQDNVTNEEEAFSSNPYLHLYKLIYLIDDDLIRLNCLVDSLILAKNALNSK